MFAIPPLLTNFATASALTFASSFTLLPCKNAGISVPAILNISPSGGTDLRRFLARINNGFNFISIIDKNYTEFESLIANL